jgi:anti-sigma factor RsiW
MKTMPLCDLFDKYRDGEMSAAERSAFEAHLNSCANCRTKELLLDRVVSLVRREAAQPIDMAARIAHRAFLKKNSWASAVVSWLHPVPAMVVLVAVLVLFSSLWIVSGSGKVSAYSEYEQLVKEVNAQNPKEQFSQTLPKNAIVDWLEQEGNSK